MRNSGARTTRLLATAVVTGLGLTLLAGSPGQAGTTTNGAAKESARAAATVYKTGFDTISDWEVKTPEGPVGPEGKSQAIYTNFNVAADGVLKVTTRRHCLKKGQKPRLKNASVKPCGKKRKTVYTSGRIEKTLNVAVGANYEMEFKAVMPKKTASGTRPALWANNLAANGYCDTGGTDIVEFDPLEWWSSKKREASHTTHIGCDPKAPTVTARQMKKSPMAPGKWFTWKVRRVGNKITYWRTDGAGTTKKVATHTCGKKKFKHIDKPRCKDLLGRGTWRIYINGEVFARAKLKPNNKKSFPKQTFKVTSFKLRQL